MYSSERSATSSPVPQFYAFDAAPATGIQVSSANQTSSCITPIDAAPPRRRPSPGFAGFFSSHPVPWSTGLFDCAADVKNCCITFWCPCITFGQISEILDKGSGLSSSSCVKNGAIYALIMYFPGMRCCYSCPYRYFMRQQYGLEESPCGDCVVHCCCEPCALCQEYRELKSHGFDMKLGWRGNMERQNPTGVAMAPTVQEGMTR